MKHTTIVTSRFLLVVVMSRSRQIPVIGVIAFSASCICCRISGFQHPVLLTRALGYIIEEATSHLTMVRFTHPSKSSYNIIIMNFVKTLKNSGGKTFIHLINILPMECARVTRDMVDQWMGQVSRYCHFRQYATKFVLSNIVECLFIIHNIYK